ncbi:MAG: hypothetical protein R3C05_20340 [Pirellulaceae bacterium]
MFHSVGTVLQVMYHDATRLGTQLADLPGHIPRGTGSRRLVLG